jgi:hypothetical protein
MTMHKFKGRKVPDAERENVARFGNPDSMPWGQSCGWCGAQWYEHEEIETDIRSLRAIVLACNLLCSTAGVYCMTAEIVIGHVRLAAAQRDYELPESIRSNEPWPKGEAIREELNRG